MFDRTGRVVLQGEGETFSATDTITFTSQGEKTGSMLKPVLSRLGKKAVAGLETAFAGNSSPIKPKLATRLLDKTVTGGLPAFTRFGYRSNKKQWKPVTESLSGKTVII